MSTTLSRIHIISVNINATIPYIDPTQTLSLLYIQMSLANRTGSSIDEQESKSRYFPCFSCYLTLAQCHTLSSWKPNLISLKTVFGELIFQNGKSTVCSSDCSGCQKREHQRPRSLALCEGNPSVISTFSNVIPNSWKSSYVKASNNCAHITSFKTIYDIQRNFERRR